MGIVCFPNSWTSHSDGVARINYGHALSQYLVAACVASPAGVQEIVSGRWMARVGSPGYGVANGVAGVTCGANAGFTMSAPPMAQRASGMTVFWYGAVTGTPAANAEFFGIHYTSALTSPFSCCVSKYGATSVISGQTNASGSLTTYGVTSTGLSARMPVSAAYHVGTLGNSIIVNGWRGLDNTTATSVNFGADPQISIGDSYPQNINPNLLFSIGYIFTGVQMKGMSLFYLHHNPYALLAPLS